MHPVPYLDAHREPLSARLLVLTWLSVCACALRDFQVVSEMSGVPYLGSRIVLISKSEIRYEGTLYTIDTTNSTVALQNVRSFGTENRKDEGAIPPSY